MWLLLVLGVMLLAGPEAITQVRLYLRDLYLKERQRLLKINDGVPNKPNKYERFSDYVHREGGYIASMIIGGCLIVAFIAYTLPMYCYYMDKQAQLEAFYNTNNQNYSIIVDKTDDLLTLSADAYLDTLVDGSIEKMEVGSAEAQRLAEWRDAVVDYNTTRSRVLKYDSSFWFGNLVPDVSYLPEIIIEE